MIIILDALAEEILYIFVSLSDEISSTELSFNSLFSTNISSNFGSSLFGNCQSNIEDLIQLFLAQTDFWVTGHDLSERKLLEKMTLSCKIFYGNHMFISVLWIFVVISSDDEIGYDEQEDRASF